MSWNDERVEALKSMWAQGMSASQIAKELGGGVSRNAVIGKVHRLGLSNRTQPPRPADRGEAQTDGQAAVQTAPAAEAKEGTPVQKPTKEPGAAPGQRSVTSAGPAEMPRPKPIVPAGQPLPPQPSNSEISEEARANLAALEKKAKRLTLMQLTERTCKWPIGDPATEDFWFCGLPTMPGKPYCETHVEVAFQPMSSRRDRRSSSR